MKKIALVLMLSLLLSGTAIAAGSATGGSTKPEPKEETPVTVAPVTTDAEKEASEEAARKARIEKQQQEASKAAQTPTAAPASAPAQSKKSTAKAPEPKLCNDIEDMKKRIECRMTKTKAEIDYELTQVYLPEECRAIKNNDTWKNTCIDRYKSLRPCWSKNFGEDRISCVKSALGLPEKLQTIDQYCSGKDDACREAYKKKIYNLVTFRFYDAEERVEEWYEDKKIDLADAVDFITFIAQSKIKFYQEAKTKADRLAIIDEVQKRWDAITAKVKK